MKTDAIHDCTFCEKDIASPNDLLAVTKLEFVDDRSRRILPQVIRVEFANCGDEQVLVRRR